VIVMSRKSIRNVERPESRRASRNTRRAAAVVLALSALGVIGPMTSASAGTVAPHHVSPRYALI
jgi:hypothetical protein